MFRQSLMLSAVVGLVTSATLAAESEVYDPSRYARAVTECDRLAAHTEDPYKVSPGVSESAVDLPAAISACLKDVEADPQNPRLLYQLGRAQAYAGQIEASLPNLEKSVDAHYPQAQFVLGYLLLDGRLKAPVDRCRAMELFRKSAAQARMASQIGLPAWSLAGRFENCANAPTTDELLDLLKAARAQKPKFYPELLIEDLERQLRVRMLR